MDKQATEKGFTIVELIVAVAMIGLLIAPIIGASFYFYAEVATKNRQTTIALESQEALRIMAEDLRGAAGLDDGNFISDPEMPGGWSPGGSYNAIIIASPAQDSSRNFIIDTGTGKPYRNEIIYFSDGTNFYRRTLPDTDATGNAMTRSCPPAEVTSSCPSDTLLSKKFDDVTYTYYDNENTPTAVASYARSVKISLSVKDNIYGRPITATNTIWITFRNS